MSNHINLQAYNSIELLSAYKTKESLKGYRNSRLSRYQPHAEFILNRSSGKPVSMIEIGSGSSVLLYKIAQKTMLTKAMGVELSKSRSEFAEQWKKDEGYEMVENVNKNFVDVEMGTELWDWFVVIDNTFTYLFPEDPNYPSLLLKKALDGLNKGGRIIIDFINYARRMPDIEYKSWSAFTANDPYSYGLYSNKITDGINRSESIFIKRDGSESNKIELCKVYSLEQLTTLLSTHGFTVDEVFATFDEHAFIAGESERLMVVARKNT
jgi:hypothetical protein